MAGNRATSVGMSNSKLEELTCDKHGEPIPILGLNQNDTDSIAEFTLTSGAGTAQTGDLIIGNLYMLTATQTGTATAGIVIIKLFFDSVITTKPLRLFSPNGQVIYIFKARTATLKMEGVVPVSILVSLHRLG